MTLAAGSKLGPYEILGQIGAGGMGEVYRARDPRLSREVAIKLLPASLSRDPDRMRRFEKEARAASALTHPQIVTIHDVIDTDGGLAIVMELVSGRTLREILADGALPLRRWLSIAVQAAEGLAKAHAAGIVHRDLKPENLMVTDDGLVKILDFGLAKLTQPDEPSGATQAPTMSGATEPGIVMGTAGYMSPEQALGKPLDFRSDQFALGSIVYEMATGKRAFVRASTPETLSAIIREDPEPMSSSAPSAPPPARWIVERCLSKEPRQRYASTEDLARDLASVRDHLSEFSIPGTAIKAPARRPRTRLLLGLVAVVAVAAAGGALAGRRLSQKPPLSFTTVTHRRGTIGSARFAPDGATVVYSAAWNGQPAQLFTRRADSPDEVPIPLPSAEILSISKSGEMAIALHCRTTHSDVCSGTLAVATITGGAARSIADNVQQVDWSPDGQSLVVARDAEGRGRLEHPLGTVIYETAGHTSFPRFSPRGDEIAFVDHPLQIDSRGSIAIMTRAGKKQTLTREWSVVSGLSWSPSGDEIWFSATPQGGGPGLYAVSRSGRERVLLRLPQQFEIHDSSRAGRLLIQQDNEKIILAGRRAGDTGERDLSWLDVTVSPKLSRDGKTLLFEEESPSLKSYETCLRGMDGSPVVRLGEGSAMALSPEGLRAVVQLVDGTYPLAIIPTGPGERRVLPQGDVHAENVAWLDERRIVIAGSKPGQARRLYAQDVAEGEPRPISDENVEASSTDGIAPTLDGKVVAAVGPEHRIRLYPVDGGAPRPLPAARVDEFPLVWSADGRWLYVREDPASEPPLRISRIEPATGRREPWKELMPADRSGFVVIGHVTLAPDGETYAYSYDQAFSQLFIAEGVR